MKKDILLHCALSLLFLMLLSIGSAQSSGPYNSNPDWNVVHPDFQESYRDSMLLWQERVVLHIANDHAGNDNLVFFKAYLLTGVQQNRYSLSGVLNVELLDKNGTRIKRQFHKVVDGTVEGHMELPKKIAPGKYSLKAYTRWMRNYGEDFFALEDITISETLNDQKEIKGPLDVFIKPEGGTLLSEHKNRVVIKIPLSRVPEIGQVGRILNVQGQKVATVNYYSNGIGTTIFKPKKDQLYQLELENGATYPIPMAPDQGYLLHVNNLDENTAKIRVTASSEVTGNVVSLVGISGGIRHFENQLDFKDSKILDIDLSKGELPSGIFNLQLIDDVGTELARRPIWIDGERLQINIEPISSKTEERAYKIKVTDHRNSPVKTQLALSAIHHEASTKKDMEKYSIDRPDLLTYPEIVDGDMTSTARKKRFLKDLSIQVSAIENISPDENGFGNRIKFPIQKGLELTGYAYDLDNKLLDNTKIQIMANTEDEVWFREAKTDANGLLRLEELQLNRNTTLVFRTKGKDIKSRLVKVIPIKEGEQEKNSSLPDIKKKPKQSGINEITAEEPLDKKPSEPANTKPLMPLIELEEVDVIENLVKKQKYAPSVYGIEVQKTHIQYQDPKKPRSIGQMLSEIPGVMVSGDFNVAPSVTITRGTGPVLWVIDGFQLAPPMAVITSLGGPVKSSSEEVMDLISAVDIERIELLIGPDAAIYGSRGAGGVIEIYTRSGVEQKFISRKEGQLVFEGYEPILDFDTYNQTLSKRSKAKAKLLYWNPKLETDENGEAIIKIPVLSHDSKIKIEASTITPDGKIGSLNVNF